MVSGLPQFTGVQEFLCGVFQSRLNVWSSALLPEVVREAER
jgi:hypothetical protein